MSGSLASDIFRPDNNCEKALFPPAELALYQGDDIGDFDRDLDLVDRTRINWGPVEILIVFASGAGGTFSLPCLDMIHLRARTAHSK